MECVCEKLKKNEGKGSQKQHFGRELTDIYDLKILYIINLLYFHWYEL